MTSSLPAAADLPGPGRAAYLLDFDGTLVDIAPTPESVLVDPALPGALRRLAACAGGAVAIVTGRPIAQVDALLGGAVGAVAGEHGTALRRSSDGAVAWTAQPALPAHWRAAAEAAAAAHPGAMLEDKRHGLVLHYRAAPQAGPALRAALAGLLAEHPGRFELLAAKMAWELRPAGVSKASAVHALMAEPPFAGRVPIFVGDDVTDEDGMEAARALGGFGMRLPDDFATPEAVRGWIVALGA